ncbi:MAG: oxidoreductase, partial [Planctomycetota bacterium]
MGEEALPLGSEILWYGQNRMDILVQIANEQAVRNLAPDLDRLARLETRGVIVTAISENGQVDFVSRFFCPSLGIDEDPVTGSA